MSNKATKGMLMSALVCGSFLVCTNAVHAGNLQEFNLDPMVVTAQGIETKDMETPAAVEVYTAEKIAASGASNVYDLLNNATGVAVQSQGFNGAAMGTMTSKIMVRGAKAGTLVLVNGVPINMDGKYNLEDIPVESIEKVEIVKGGGSVLYGSDATGGVINIITKNVMNNKIKVSAGNFGKERYDVSVGAAGFNVAAGLENRGHANNMSGLKDGASKGTVYDYGGGERKSVIWSYDLSEGLRFTHNFSQNEHEYLQREFNKLNYKEYRKYHNTDNSFLLNYDKDDWKAYISYGTQEKVYDKAKYNPDGSRKALENNNQRKGHNTNIKVQKKFDIGEDSLIVGSSFQREDMDLQYQKYMEYERNNYSLYLSYNKQLDESQNLILNMRETWIEGSSAKETDKAGKVTTSENDNMSKFTPEVEYLYKISDNSSAYAKAGKSFRMPNLTQLYGTGGSDAIIPTTNLKPEKGTHYEIGYKLNTEKNSLRIAAFTYKIDDSLSPKWTDNNESIYYVNQDFRNSGLEVSYTTAHDQNWSSSIGLTYSNPQAQDYSEYGDDSWHDCYGKYQVNGSVTYTDDKFTGILSGNYVGDRTSANKDENKKKSQFFTDLDLSYRPEANQKVFFHLNNILDRRDVTTNSSSNFYTLGRNFIVGYEYNF